MSEAPNMPKRIWADWLETFGSVETGTWVDTLRHSKQQHEYIRADLVEAAVKRAIEACAEACDANHRGGLPKHIQSADGVLLRKWLSDPEAIAKIIGGDA